MSTPKLRPPQPEWERRFMVQLRDDMYDRIGGATRQAAFALTGNTCRRRQWPDFRLITRFLRNPPINQPGFNGKILVSAMKTLFKIGLIIIAVPIAIIAIWLTIFSVSIHFKTEGKITAALESGFPGEEVSINDRVDWDHDNQICFDVTARPKSPGVAKRAIVMVQGDLDGGTWALSRRRYSSLRECKKDFYRG